MHTAIAQLPASVPVQSPLDPISVFGEGGLRCGGVEVEDGLGSVEREVRSTQAEVDEKRARCAARGIEQPVNCGDRLARREGVWLSSGVRVWYFARGVLAPTHLAAGRRAFVVRKVRAPLRPSEVSSEGASWVWPKDFAIGGDCVPPRLVDVEEGGLKGGVVVPARLLMRPTAAAVEDAQGILRRVVVVVVAGGGGGGEDSCGGGEV